MRITIETLVDNLADIINLNFQTYLTEVNGENDDFELETYNPEALYEFELYSLGAFPVSYLISVLDNIEPVTNEGRSAADRVILQFLTIIPDNASDTIRRRGFRYCEAMRRLYDSSITASPMFRSATYRGVNVSPPLAMEGSGQAIIVASIQFSLDIAY